jgi:cyclopropane-fatty-acyl-phospholipid synthase
MVYSCAYFGQPDWSIEQAQLAKLDLVCRKLGLRPGDQFLDIGCGWGALLLHAAQNYGASATGCTLSPQQADYARQAAGGNELDSRITVFLRDYRDVEGEFDKIASIGMFEHVGRRRLPKYFKRMRNLLSPHGLFLNHGIVRRGGVNPGPESMFIRRKVFPGSELVYLSDVLREAERAGFEILDVENLRPHYALTCRAWVARMQQNHDSCLREVDEKTYRTWLLYLAASAVNFEEGFADVHQVLLSRSGNPQRPMTRDYFLIR